MTEDELFATLERIFDRVYSGGNKHMAEALLEALSAEMESRGK